MSENAANWEHCLEHAALSDVGLRRSNNQDSMTVAIANSQQAWLQRGHLFVVADGMGAHAAGELASKLAVDTVPLAYQKRTDLPPPEALVAAVTDANAHIYSRGSASEDFRGMGTTIDSLLLLPQGALVAHVGDSRAYRLRGNTYEQLTFDHSLVWEMRAAGQIPEGETPSYIPKNIITRSLGPGPSVKIDLEGPFPLQVGDTFLLCSDGLSGPVEDIEMGTILACLPPQQAAQMLIDLANLRGGPDNVTVIVAKVTGPQMARQSESPTGDDQLAPRRPVPTLVWTLMGLFALAAVGMFALKFWAAGLAGLIGCLITVIVALIVRQSEAGTGAQADRRRFGRGPYTSCDCTPSEQSVAGLAKIVQQLRDAAAAEDWDIDWSRFNSLGSQADQAVAAGDYAQAVKQHCAAIGFMMAELKSQRNKKASDSSLDLN